MSFLLFSFRGAFSDGNLKFAHGLLHSFIFGDEQQVFVEAAKGVEYHGVGTEGYGVSAFFDGVKCGAADSGALRDEVGGQVSPQSCQLDLITELR